MAKIEYAVKIKGLDLYFNGEGFEPFATVANWAFYPNMKEAKAAADYLRTQCGERRELVVVPNIAKRKA